MLIGWLSNSISIYTRLIKSLLLQLCVLFKFTLNTNDIMFSLLIAFIFFSVHYLYCFHQPKILIYWMRSANLCKTPSSEDDDAFILTLLYPFSFLNIWQAYTMMGLHNDGFVSCFYAFWLVHCKHHSQGLQ